MCMFNDWCTSRLGIEVQLLHDCRLLNLSTHHDHYHCSWSLNGLQAAEFWRRSIASRSCARRRIVSFIVWPPAGEHVLETRNQFLLHSNARNRSIMLNIYCAKVFEKNTQRIFRVNKLSRVCSHSWQWITYNFSAMVYALCMWRGAGDESIVYWEKERWCCHYSKYVCGYSACSNFCDEMCRHPCYLSS